MPLRIPIPSALRQGVSFLKTPTAPLSTTAAPRALRDLGNSPSSILNMDGPSNNANSIDLAGDIFQRINLRKRPNQNRSNLEKDLRVKERQEDYIRQLTRRWRAGDVYSPHDMSPSEMAKWRRNTARKRDLVDLLGLRPLDMYRNFSVISEFITSHGRIKRSVDTGLKPANQRKMAKAIRRAIGLGLHPSVHQHPEILMRGPNKTLTQNMPTMNRTLIPF